MKRYVTTAFSLGMLGDVKEASIDVKTTCACALKSAVEKGAELRIGHQSTADVIGEMLGMEITADRTPIQIQKNEVTTLYVIQLLKRPAEGQVYTKEEIKEIINRRLLKIYKVTVYT